MMPAFFWSALTLGRALGTAFLRHFSEDRVLRFGYAAGASGIGLMVWAPSVPGVIGGALITRLSFATLYPITLARPSHTFGVSAPCLGARVTSPTTLVPAHVS